MIGPRNSLPINTEVIPNKHVLPGVKCNKYTFTHIFLCNTTTTDVPTLYVIVCASSVSKTVINQSRINVIHTLFDYIKHSCMVDLIIKCTGLM